MNSALPPIPESADDRLLSVLTELLRERFGLPTEEPDQTRAMITAWVDKIRARPEFIEIDSTHTDAFLRQVLEFSAKTIPLVFFTPEAVHLLYSPHESASGHFIEQGFAYHFRLIRQAVDGIARRSPASLTSVTISPDEFQSYLMEQILACLTDPYARLWSMENPTCWLFPPKNIRGHKSGVVLRVALSPNGDRLATVHSSHTLNLWDTVQPQWLGSWDLQSLLPKNHSRSAEIEPPHIFFSETRPLVAVEVPQGCIYTFSLMKPEDEFRAYQASDNHPFFQEFGDPYIPDSSLVSRDRFSFQSRDEQPSAWEEYAGSVYGWSCDREGRKVATAGELDRRMPEWMVKIGFERAVYLIAKRRWIDFIRKHTQTGYRCWRCGTVGVGPKERLCARCGADFTRCLLGCSIPPSASLDRENHWTCPHCGCSTRTVESQREIHEELDDTFATVMEDSWKDTHDLERWYNLLRRIVLTHGGQPIPCDRLARLKAEGKTNEEIGKILRIPRGSVDYVWSQCRSHILRLLGKNWING